MNKYLLTTIKFLLFTALGIFLIWLAVKDITIEDEIQIKNSISRANYWWILVSMFAGVLSHISRAVRWKMLLVPLEFNPKLSNTFYAVMIGYLGNLAPLRIGEVLRCGILKRYEKIPLTQSFGTVIAERVIDVLMLLLLFIFSVWIEYARIQAYLSEHFLTPLMHKVQSQLENKMMLALSIAVTAGVLIAIFLFRKKIFQNPLVLKIRELLLSFLLGVRTVAKVKSPLLFIFHSFFIWAMYLSTVFVCVFAFQETASLTLSDCLVIMAFGSFGVIATPGGIGAYQWIVLQIMILWGYTTATGVAFGWVVWLAQTVVVLLFGLLSFAFLAINNNESTKIEIPNNN